MRTVCIDAAALETALECARSLAKVYLTDPTDDQVVRLADSLLRAKGADDLELAVRAGLENIARSICNAVNSDLADSINSVGALTQDGLRWVSTAIDDMTKHGG